MMTEWQTLCAALGGGVLVLIQTIEEQQHDIHDGLAVFLAFGFGTIGVLICIMLLGLIWKCEEAIRQIMHQLHFFHLVVWICGTTAMTLDWPTLDGLYSSQNVGNGFFGCWLTLMLSWRLTCDSCSYAQDQLASLCRHGAWPVEHLMLLSLALWVQTFWLMMWNPARSQLLWIQACSCGTFLLCLLLHMPPLPLIAKTKANIFRYVALFLAIGWGMTVLLGTFSAPYIDVGNGYFCCWFGFFETLYLLDGIWKEEAPEEDRTTTLAGVLLFCASQAVLIDATYGGSGHIMEYWMFLVILIFISSWLLGLLLLGRAFGACTARVDCLLPGLSLFLLLFWSACVACLTCGEPFRYAGNGYFGCWIAVASAAMLCQANLPAFAALTTRFGKQGPPLFGLAIASLTLTVQSVFLSGSVSAVLLVVAVAGGSLSLLACVAVLLCFSRLAGKLRTASLGWCILWAILTAALTIHRTAPYMAYPGNGYFACWGGTLCAFRLLHSLDVAPAAEDPEAQAQEDAPSVSAPPADPAVGAAVASPVRHYPTDIDKE